MSRNDENTSMG